MPKLIDTHTHLNFQAFADDFEDVIERTLAADTWFINVGTQFDTSRRAVEIAENHSDGVYAAVGLHPIHLFSEHVDEEESSFQTREEKFDPQSYKELIQRSTKVVAIGEFGLDYYRLPQRLDPEKIKETQREITRQHLQLATELDKPVSIHCRDAYEDLHKILKNSFSGLGVIHSFTGTWEQAKKFLDLGFSIGINGILTFDKTGQIAQVVKNTPMDRLVLETDAPYLTPIPHRGKRNEPLFTEFVGKKMAEVKGLSEEEVFGETTENARRLFRI